MKKLLLMFAIAGITCTAQAQLKTPAPSTNQKVTQEFGLGTIDLSYSRPSAKGRKVMGGLVPFGKVWRTGANQATTVTFSDDVTIGGKEIKAGKYGLLSIPNADKWTMIITKDLTVTSPAAYKQENDVVRVDCQTFELPMAIETFGITVENITANSCDLMLIWENTVLMLPIKTDVDAKVMNQIKTVMGDDAKPFHPSAQYYFDNGKDLKQAKAWSDKAVAANPNAYWMSLLNAKISAKLGDKAAATAMLKKTIDLATKAKNDDYVKMANELMKTL